MYGLVSEGIKGNCMRVLFESDSGGVIKLCQINGFYCTGCECLMEAQEACMNSS